jgi:formylglycine-generating enzyme required for sulfatase activity
MGTCVARPDEVTLARAFVTSSTALLALAVAAGCIAEPHVLLHESAADARDEDESAVSAEDEGVMVLVPTTAVVVPRDLAPASADKGKGKGKGGEDDPGEPGTPVTVPAFWIDAHEVSASAYAACVLAGACDAAASDVGCTVAAGLGEHPVNCVSLDQARGFCEWRGKRLVRNDEWTVASAGGSERPYPWGQARPAVDRLNACGAECASPSMYPESDAHPRTAPRGTFPLGRSPEGVYDLAGNVAEWTDVVGASLVRGGSFEDVDPAAVGSLSMRVVAGGAPSAAIGFRCAKDG